MSPSTSSGPSPRTSQLELTVERRGWLWRGAATLAISGLGLAVAGAVIPPSSAASPRTVTAESRTGGAAAQVAPGTSTVVRAQVDEGGLPSTRVGSTGADSARATRIVARGSLAAFGAATRADIIPGDPAVQRAVVKERAAQRAESLSKQAEDAARVTQSAAKSVRHQKLAATDREIQQTAVQIAAERRQRALALRIAAEVARRRAQFDAAAAAQTTTPAPGVPPVTTTTTTTVPAAGHGVSPVPGAVIGTPFGATGIWARYHTGLDFRAAEGTPIHAVQSGVVLYAGNSGNWAGNHVAILHAGGITTMSSHMSSMAVHVGEQVAAGQVIGRVGQTGRAFGAHLHFEVYPRGVKYGDIYHAVNPVPWLEANGVHTQ